MAIKVYSKKEVSELNIPRNYKGGVTKYPWYELEVGGAFHVPRSHYKTENYRPSPPPNLQKMGYKVSTTKYTRDDQVDGLMVQRIA